VASEALKIRKQFNTVSTDAKIYSVRGFVSAHALQFVDLQDDQDHPVACWHRFEEFSSLVWSGTSEILNEFSLQPTDLVSILAMLLLGTAMEHWQVHEKFVFVATRATCVEDMTVF